MDLKATFEWLSTLNPWIGYATLGAAATIEHIFPPFPGDAITLFGSVLSHNAGWSFWGVLAAVTLGSVIGGMVDYEVGVWLGRSHKDTWLHRQMRSENVAPKIEWIKVKFLRYGPDYIAVNRFVPGVRGAFFLAAGMAGLSRPAVAFYTGVSALAWNLMITLVGHLIGFQVEAMLDWMARYTTVAWSVILLAALAFGARHLWKRRQAR